MPLLKKYNRTPPSVPMLINRLLHQNVETLEENLMITAFQYGIADKQHYDYLTRMANMLNIANQYKPSDVGLSLATNLTWLTENIAEHYNAHGNFRLSVINLKLMRATVHAYDLYWKTQTTHFYNKCVAELSAFYAELGQQKALS